MVSCSGWTQQGKLLQVRAEMFQWATAALQAHMGRLELPITDYVGDTKSALDNSVRILQAITDVAADAGWLGTTLATMRLIQGLMQVKVPGISSPYLRCRR